MLRTAAMKVLDFMNGIQEWNVPLEELSPGLRRMLRMQWKEFINQLDDVNQVNYSHTFERAKIGRIKRASTAA